MGNARDAINRWISSPTLLALRDALVQLDNNPAGSPAASSTRTVVATIAQMIALDVAALGYVAGQEVYVVEIPDTFLLGTWTGAFTGGTGPYTKVPATNAGGLSWGRRQDTNENARRVTAWFVSAATGNDKNDGLTSGTALHSADEIWRRNGGWFPNNATITFVDGPASFAGPIRIIDLTATSRARINVVGTPTQLSTGTIVAATAHAGNLFSTVQLSGAVGAGVLIRMTSGAQNGNIAPILYAPAADTAAIPVTFMTQAGGAAGLPAPGDAYEILSLPQQFSAAHGASIEVTYKWLDLPGRPQAPVWNLIGCKVDVLDSSLTASCVATMSGCVLGAPAAILEAGSVSAWKFSFCAFRGAVRVADGASARLISTVHRDATATTPLIEVGGAASTLSSFSSLATVELNGVGVSDSPAAGVRVAPMGFARITGELYGQGNLVGYADDIGSTVLDAIAPTPTLTGTTELALDGAGTAIPALAPGAVPAASPLTTWAELVAPPFAGNVVSYTTGARIVTG